MRPRSMRSGDDCCGVGSTNCVSPANVTPPARPIDRVRVRKLASSYVLLETRISPNRLELDSPVRANALGDLYVFIREVEAASAAGTSVGTSM